MTAVAVESAAAVVVAVVTAKEKTVPEGASLIATAEMAEGRP